MSGLQILRRPEVLEKVPICRSAMYAMIAAGEFPKPIKLGPRSVGWISTEIDEWLEARIKARNEEVNHG